MKAAIHILTTLCLACFGSACHAQLLAGTGRVEISEKSVPQNDPLYVKALVLKQGDETAVLITLDAVSIGGIGYVPDTWLPAVRQSLQQTLGIPPLSVFANASHCHGVVCKDVLERTVEAVTAAWKSLQPVQAGSGVGQEVRIMENRRLQLSDGSEADVRRAYSMPWDDEVTGIGPVDPEIGLLQLNRADGTPLAVVYNFACHPIHGVPSGVSTADFPGYASAVIEETLGHGVLAFFVQGCAGDINPATYKDVAAPHDCEPFGNMLGLNVLRGLRTITTFSADAGLKARNRSLQIPRATDYADRIRAIEAEQLRMLGQLKGTNINFRTFVPLYIQHSLNPDYPGYYSHRYMLDERLGRTDMRQLDAENQASLKAYVENIRTMEKLTKLQTNLNLLKMHQQRTEAAGDAPLLAEVGGLRVGDFVLATFPGEVTVQIGLNIKQASPHRLTFVAGYTNGYIWYTPTAQQRSNTGYAQEDCDSIVAPQWQQLFEDAVSEMLQEL